MWKGCRRWPWQQILPWWENGAGFKLGSIKSASWSRRHHLHFFFPPNRMTFDKKSAVNPLELHFRTDFDPICKTTSKWSSGARCNLTQQSKCEFVSNPHTAFPQIKICKWGGIKSWIQEGGRSRRRLQESFHNGCYMMGGWSHVTPSGLHLQQEQRHLVAPWWWSSCTRARMKHSTHQSPLMLC